MAKNARGLAAAARGEEKPGADDGDPGPALGGPGSLGGKAFGKAVKAKRGELKDSGLRGKGLRDALAGYRGELETQRDAESMDALGLQPRAAGYVKNPSKFMRKVAKGKGPAMRRLLMLQQVTKDLGYDDDKNALREQYDKSLDENGRPVMDYHEDTTPVFDEFQSYVADHLNDPTTGEAVGLTPAQKAMYYGVQHDQIRANDARTNENEMSRLAASGIDPRSGLGAARSMAISANTGAQLAQAGRNTEEANLDRVRDFESYGAGLSNLEESRRSGNVNADLTRLAQVESGMGGMAGLSERGRQFDIDYTENQRQAKMAREDMRKAAEDMEPSTTEKVTSGIGGFFSGL